MKKLLTLCLIGFAAYVGYSDWMRLRREVGLEAGIKELLRTVPANAAGLAVPQYQQLARLVSQHGFALRPGTVRFATTPTDRRPADAIANTSKYTEHVLDYVCMRPNTFLPFRLEEHAVRTTVLVEIPNSGISFPGGGAGVVGGML